MDIESPSDRQVRALRVLFESRGISFDKIRADHLARLAWLLAEIRAEVAREEAEAAAGKAA